MSDRKPKSQPERRTPRVPYELPVAYQTLSGFITDWAVNISRGGIFISTPTPLPVGTRVKLILSLPDVSFPFELMGRVVHINELSRAPHQVPGMGVEFVDVDDEKRARIERFVERLRQELPEQGSGRSRK